MKQLFFIVVVFAPSVLFGQQDTVFIKHTKDWAADTLSYTTDTLIFTNGTMATHILTGTTVLPSTHNQMRAREYALYLHSVTKSDCKQDGNEYGIGQNKINSIVSTNSKLVIDITITENCCYDFLCDISVDSSATLNLIYNGYGTYCACNCCFGLTFQCSGFGGEGYKDIKAVMINGDRKTIKQIKK